ncbi:family 15 glycosyl hydrolase [Podospora didyma]|uniref:glucan 1,4-alpha-glucosidase n=1 Tax=Podospora didyma TaxID=330526 RepID=A0AAE0NZJ2_9PEZI|nr:family 15 glycosyl hydrolase [Podospora didyma]
MKRWKVSCVRWVYKIVSHICELLGCVRIHEKDRRKERKYIRHFLASNTQPCVGGCSRRLSFRRPRRPPTTSCYTVLGYPGGGQYLDSHTMLRTSRLVLAAAAGLLASSPVVSAAWPQDVGLESFIETERAIALQGVLNNIGPNGTKVPGAAAGIVIASPSKVNPNYFYTWTRDAALTFKTLVDGLLFGNTALQPYIEDYIHAQAILQTITNPSGTLLPSGTGLGEPKFNADGSRYNGNWGRPQRDGPPLRATALIGYAHWLLEHGEMEKVKSVVWPVISNDLSYVGQYWNSTGFDLWEEVSGSSFFTTQNQARSLIEGAALADALGVPCAACAQAPQILCFLQSYWNGKFFTATINTNTGRGGVDANTVLGPIALFDIKASCDSPTLQPCHSRVLANFKVFVDTFRNPSLYPINAGIPSTSGIALGRYPEDTYYDGNPWYLITLGAAELLYDAVAQWTHHGSITVDTTSLPFFQSLYPSAQAGKTYKRCAKTSPFRLIADAALAYADSFVSIAQKYTPVDGSLAEQFLKTSPGTPLSAAALTWSFASFVSMAERRGGQFPPSWVPTSPPLSLPETCSGTSQHGIYAPATGAGAPNGTAPCLSSVLFVVNASTYYGENIYLVGNTTDLGSWNLDNSQPMLSSNYTAERPMWFATLALEAGEHVSYGYARQQDCGRDPIWETVNRTLVVPACVEGSTAVLLETDDAWAGDVGTPGGC